MADSKISNLTAGTVAASDDFAFVQSGTTKTDTVQGILDLVPGAANLGDSDLTSTDNNRIFALNGNLSTNLLTIESASGSDIAQFRGDGTVYFLNNISSGVTPSTNFRFYASDTGLLGGFYSVGSGTRGYYASGAQNNSFEAQNTKSGGVGFKADLSGTSGNHFGGYFIARGTATSINKAIVLDANGGSTNYAFEIIAGDFNLADTTNGHKFGTATTQKMGFWNATPIAQPAALTAADATATDGTIGTADTIINNLRTRLNELEAALSASGGGSGLIA